MSHYETLGVPRDASDEDIKKAYRKAAMTHHPDRTGGDDDQFKRVKDAYECLSDRDRRAHYDETGEDRVDSLHDAASALVIRLFGQALADDMPIVSHTRNSLREMTGKIDAHKRTLSARRERLEARRGTVSTTNGAPNIVHQMIDAALHDIEKSTRAVEREHAVVQLAIEMVKVYVEQPMPTVDTIVPTATTSTGSFFWFR